jgi:hypothetical protein
MLPERAKPYSVRTEAFPVGQAEVSSNACGMYLGVMVATGLARFGMTLG